MSITERDQISCESHNKTTMNSKSMGAEQYGEDPSHQLVDSEPETNVRPTPKLMKIIIDDREDAFREEMDKLSLGTSRRFLGSVESTVGVSKKAKKRKEKYLRENGYDVCSFQLHTPWCLAAAYGAHKVMTYLVRRGADVLQQDTEGCNVIHALIYVAFLQADREEQTMRTLEFIRSIIDVEQFHELLLMETDKGLRPLELASHLGTFGLFGIIFQTKGVYLTKEEVNGIYTTQWFDITEYESADQENRRTKSPLLFLLFVDNSKLGDKYTRLLTSSSQTGNVLTDWVNRKTTCNNIFVLLWFLLRLVMVFAFFAGISLGEKLIDHQNKVRLDNKRNATDTYFNVTPEHANELVSNGDLSPTWTFCAIACLTYLFIYSLLSILLDMTEFYQLSWGKQSWMFCTPRGRKTLLVNLLTYRIVQFSLSCNVLFVTTAFVALREMVLTLPRIFDHVCMIHAALNLVSSIRFFLQRIPYIGEFVVIYERMVQNLGCFVAVYVVFLIPYALIFRHITCDDVDKSMCNERFSTLPQAMYTIFTITLNMVDFTQYNLGFKVEVYIMHVQYVISVVMLLLNFLIAQFTNAVAETVDNKALVMVIQKLSVVWTIELRLMTFLRCWYRWLHRRYFVIINGRMYVSRTLVTYIPPRQTNSSPAQNVSMR